MASGPRLIAATPVRDTSTSPKGRIRSTKRVDLGGRAGDLEDKTGLGGIDGAGAEGIGHAQRLDPLLAGARHLDQRHLALDPGLGDWSSW